MKFRFLLPIAFIAIATLSACTEDTAGIGSSLTDETDKLQVATGRFNVTTRSILADSVFSHGHNFYLGRVRDPETGGYVKTEFMTQFNMMSSFFQSLPAKDEILSQYEGDVAADSCEIYLYFDRSAYYGDTLTAMKIKVSELSTPMDETQKLYTNYDPKAEGLIADGRLQKNMMFTIRNLTINDSIRNLIKTDTQGQYYDMLQVWLNDAYTDKEGKTYNNYGTYLLRQYFEHPEHFKNSYNFIHNVCPGFYFEVTDGLGLMTKMLGATLRLYYHFEEDTTAYVGYVAGASTEEVRQATKVTNDKKALQRLIDDTSCTYLKSPAGIFTEATLPIDEVTSAHANDSLLSASISFQRMNSTMPNNEYVLSAPSTVLMVQKDSLYSFFEEEKMYDYITSYVSSLSQNAYSFNNIGNIITQMYHNKQEGLKSDPNWVQNHPDWNKVVLVPIDIRTTSTSTGSSTVTGISNQISLSSTRLVGGSSDSPIELNVVYAKFKEK